MIEMVAKKYVQSMLVEWCFVSKYRYGDIVIDVMKG